MPEPRRIPTWRERMAVVGDSPVADDRASDIMREVQERAAMDGPTKPQEASDPDAAYYASRRSERLSALRSAIPEAMRLSGVPERILAEWRKCKFGFVEGTPASFRDISDRAGKLGESFLLHGPRGTGKSHCGAVAMGLHFERMAEMLVEHADEAELDIDPTAATAHAEGLAATALWMPWRTLLNGLREEFSGDKRSLASRVAEVPWLVLDDISSVAKLTAFAVDAFRGVIEDRYDAKRPTFMSSNLDPGELESMLNRALVREGFDSKHASQLTEPIISRMVSMAERGKNVVAVSGEDRRLS